VPALVSSRCEQHLAAWLELQTLSLLPLLMASAGIQFAVHSLSRHICSHMLHTCRMDVWLLPSRLLAWGSNLVPACIWRKRCSRLTLV
jgi:hypothetical protein